MLFSEARAATTVGTYAGEKIGQKVGVEATPVKDNFLPKDTLVNYIKSFWEKDTINSCKPHPKLLEDIAHIIIDLQNKGWDPKVVELCRTEAQQREKVEKGYSQTMHSKHLRGRAVDIVDRRYLWNIKPNHEFWKDLGRACKDRGLIWGGDWKGFLDVAHCEMPENQ